MHELAEVFCDALFVEADIALVYLTGRLYIMISTDGKRHIITISERGEWLLYKEKEINLDGSCIQDMALNSKTIENVKSETIEMVKSLMGADLVEVILYGSCARGDYIFLSTAALENVYFDSRFPEPLLLTNS